MKLAILDQLSALNPEGEEAVITAQNWQAQPGILEAIAQFNRAGWHVALASNQPGLGRGSFDVTELNALHLRVQRVLAAAGARVEAVFFCPHAPEDGCLCRKPAPGLLQQIAMRYGAQPHEIWAIAQDTVHLQAGCALGAHLAWVGPTGTMSTADLGRDVPVYTCWQDLADALAPPVIQPPSPSVS